MKGVLCMTVTCPNCGSEIPVPNRKKKSIQCPYCDMGGLELDLDYFDEESNQPVTGWRSFEFQHPRAAKAVKATGYTAVAAMLAVGGIELAKDKIAELTTSPETKSADEPLIPESPADNSLSDSSVPEATNSYISPDEYDSVLRQHDLSIRNLGENRVHSPEKEKQAADLGIKLPPHQTIVNPFPQHHRVKKQES
jgi:hypothetical protein